MVGVPVGRRGPRPVPLWSACPCGCCCVPDPNRREDGKGRGGCSGGLADFTGQPGSGRPPSGQGGVSCRAGPVEEKMAKPPCISYFCVRRSHRPPCRAPCLRFSPGWLGSPRSSQHPLLSLFVARDLRTAYLRAGRSIPWPERTFRHQNIATSEPDSRITIGVVPPPTPLSPVCCHAVALNHSWVSLKV